MGGGGKQGMKAGRGKSHSGRGLERMSECKR